LTKKCPFVSVRTHTNVHECLEENCGVYNMELEACGFRIKIVEGIGTEVQWKVRK